MKEVSQLEVTVSQLAESLDVSEPRIRQLASQGVVVRTTRGRYALLPSIRAYLRHRESEFTAPEAQRREARAQREHERWLQDTQVNAGELIPKRRQTDLVEVFDMAIQKAIPTFDGPLRAALSRGRGGGAISQAEIYSITNPFDAALRAWTFSGIEMLDRGATADEVKRHLFNGFSTPPIGPVPFGTEQTRKRRKARRDDSED